MNTVRKELEEVYQSDTPESGSDPAEGLAQFERGERVSSDWVVDEQDLPPLPENNMEPGLKHRGCHVAADVPALREHPGVSVDTPVGQAAQF